MKLFLSNQKTFTKPPLKTIMTTVLALFSVFAVIIGVYYYYLFIHRNSSKFDTVFEWNYINFTWNSLEQMEEFGFGPGEDVITGIKVFGEVVYLTLMRNKTSSRVTLASVSLNDSKLNPLLSPYPSWEFNSGVDCSNLQDVLSIEIDPNGILWALDGTRRSNLTQCPAKLVLFDTKNGGKMVQAFEFPEEICSVKNRCFLDDIVLDGDWAFITDTTARDPGLVVYNRATNSIWKTRDSNTMKADPVAFNFTAQDVQNTMMGNINGIAMDPALFTGRRLYYTPQISFHIYSIPVKVLKDEKKATGNISHYVLDHGKKPAATDGMIGDSKGNIYFGLLPLDQINRWDTSRPLDTSQKIEQNYQTLRWPDGFSVNQGFVYVVTNSMLRFKEVGISESLHEVNFRVLRFFSGTDSYQYGENYIW